MRWSTTGTSLAQIRSDARTERFPDGPILARESAIMLAIVFATLIVAQPASTQADPDKQPTKARMELAVLFDCSSVKWVGRNGAIDDIHIDPNWVAIVVAKSGGAPESQLSAVLKADALNVIAKSDTLETCGKAIYVIPREALRSKSELLSDAGHMALPSLQPVLERKGERIFPFGTLTARAKSLDRVGDAKAAITDRGLKVLAEDGIKLKCELTDKAKVPSVFDASVELSRMSDLFTSARPEVATRVKPLGVVSH